MRKILFMFILMALAAVPCRAYEKEFVTGQDWVEHMSNREKFMSLVPPTFLFAEYDVDLKLSLPQYMTLIDHVMERNPKLESEGLSNIFASTIFFFEPQNRQALKTMEMNFLRGELETKPYHSPRLSIQDVLKEASE